MFELGHKNFLAKPFNKTQQEIMDSLTPALESRRNSVLKLRGAVGDIVKAKKQPSPVSTASSIGHHHSKSFSSSSFSGNYNKPNKLAGTFTAGAALKKMNDLSSSPASSSISSSQQSARLSKPSSLPPRLKTFSLIPLNVNLPRQKTNIISAVGTGNGFSMILLADGSVWSCGDAEKGKLGIPKIEENDCDTTKKENKSSSSTNTSPSFITSSSPVVTSSSSSFPELRSVLDSVKSLGVISNDHHRFPYPINISSLSPIIKDVIIINVACGAEHSLMLSNIGDVYVCGNGNDGRLGLGRTDIGYVFQPRKLKTLGPDVDRTMVSISCGLDFSMAIAVSSSSAATQSDENNNKSNRHDGSSRSFLYVWGNNKSNALGLSVGEDDNGDITTDQSISGDVVPRHCVWEPVKATVIDDSPRRINEHALSSSPSQSMNELDVLYVNCGDYHSGWIIIEKNKYFFSL
jgi:hypothetical protein